MIVLFMHFSEIKIFREYSEATTYSKDLVNYETTIQPQTGAPDEGTEDAGNVEFYDKISFGYLMHVVGCFIRR
jgi:hypothetical protein